MHLHILLICISEEIPSSSIKIDTVASAFIITHHTRQTSTCLLIDKHNMFAHILHSHSFNLFPFDSNVKQTNSNFCLKFENPEFIFFMISFVQLYFHLISIIQTNYSNFFLKFEVHEFFIFHIFIHSTLFLFVVYKKRIKSNFCLRIMNYILKVWLLLALHFILV